MHAGGRYPPIVGAARFLAGGDVCARALWLRRTYTPRPRVSAWLPFSFGSCCFVLSVRSPPRAPKRAARLPGAEGPTSPNNTTEAELLRMLPENLVNILPITDHYIKTASTIVTWEYVRPRKLPSIRRASGHFIEQGGVGPGDPIQYGIIEDDLIIFGIRTSDGQIHICDPDGIQSFRGSHPASPMPAPHGTPRRTCGAAEPAVRGRPGNRRAPPPPSKRTRAPPLCLPAAAFTPKELARARLLVPRQQLGLSSDVRNPDPYARLYFNGDRDLIPSNEHSTVANAEVRSRPPRRRPRRPRR